VVWLGDIGRDQFFYILSALGGESVLLAFSDQEQSQQLVGLQG
jgi:hypothetical protein